MAFATRLPTASLSTCASPRTCRPRVAAAHDARRRRSPPGSRARRPPRRRPRRRDDPLLGELVGRLQPREVHDARGQQRRAGPPRRVSRAAKMRTCGGSSAADSIASASRLTAPTGVFSSWLVLATKSRRICSTRSRSVMSRITSRREARRDARRAHHDEARLGRRRAAAQAQRRRSPAAPASRARRASVAQSSLGSALALASAEGPRRGGCRERP